MDDGDDDGAFVRRTVDAFVGSLRPDARQLPDDIVDPDPSGWGSVGTIELKHVPNYPATYGAAAVPPEGMTLMEKMMWARSQPEQSVLFVKNVRIRTAARGRGLMGALLVRACALDWVDVVVVVESVQNVEWGRRLMGTAGFRAAPGFPDGEVTHGGNLYKMCERMRSPRGQRARFASARMFASIAAHATVDGDDDAEELRRADDEAMRTAVAFAEGIARRDQRIEWTKAPRGERFYDVWPEVETTA